MVIDCHTHVTGSHGARRKPEDLIASMDEAGIEYSLLIADFHSHTNRGVTNEEVIEIVAKHFPRIQAIGNVDYATLDSAQEAKLKHYIEKRVIVGLKCYLGYEHFYPADEKLFELYAFCSERNAPVMFHTGITESSHRTVLKYAKPLGVDEVASLFPDLKIVIAHMGNPWIADCAAVVAKNKNVYVDCSGYFKEYSPIEEVEADRFREQMREFRIFVGDYKKLLFGTDWPIYSQGEYLSVVQTLPMTDEERELVFRGNAETLFGIP